MSGVRERLVRGLLSGLLYEAFMVIVSFGGMLALVRLLTPRDYGEAAAVTGVLALARAFSGALFAEHALQHGKDREPDWDAYLAIVGAVQIALFLAINLVAAALRASDAMASIAPLLHVASVGLLFDWPAQVATVKLRRELRFERLKVLAGIAFVLRFASAIPLAWWGFGALALVISGNVLLALPMTIHFLAVERWRPRGGTLSWPAAAERAPIVAFAREQIAGGLVLSLRSAAESVVLTRVFGTTTFGLLNRALALYQSTIGRLGHVFLDTAYPLLPMEQGDRVRYSHRASRFVEAALILVTPGAAFLVIEGAQVSRVLFGSTWVDADPYLAPGAVALAAASLATAASYVLLGAGRVRESVIAEGLTAIGGLAALTATWLSNAPVHYMWTLAVAQIVAATGAFAMAAPLIHPSWLRQGLWPSVAASVAGVLGVIAIKSSLPIEGTLAVVVTATAFAAIGTTVILVTARAVVLEVLHTRKRSPLQAAYPAQHQAKA